MELIPINGLGSFEYRDVEHDSQIPKCVCKLAQELQHARNQLLPALKFVEGPV